MLALRGHGFREEDDCICQRIGNDPCPRTTALSAEAFDTIGSSTREGQNPNSVVAGKAQEDAALNSQQRAVQNGLVSIVSSAGHMRRSRLPSSSDIVLGA